MELNKVMDIINSHKAGQFHSVEWEKELKTYKGINAKVTKHSKASGVRLGVTYDNMASVVEKRELGVLPKKNGGLPYGTWDVGNYIINAQSGPQLRISTTANTKVETEYRINGEIVQKSDLDGVVLRSELPSKKELSDVFNLKVANIINIK